MCPIAAQEDISLLYGLAIKGGEEDVEHDLLTLLYSTLQNAFNAFIPTVKADEIWSKMHSKMKGKKPRDEQLGVLNYRKKHLDHLKI